MKICLISITNLFLCPYIGKYLQLIGTGNRIDLIYWNRHGTDDDIKRYNSAYEFKIPLDEGQSRLVKLKCFIRYARFCKKLLTKNEYDRVIFLHNNAALVMPFYLYRKYAKRYIVDIRDYTMEYNTFFRMLEEFVIRNAGMMVISSPGYKNFLPKGTYYVCHNDSQVSTKDDDLLCGMCAADAPIRISFIGLVRFFDQNKRLLDIFGNDKRFIMAFYGQNSEQLAAYSRSKEYENVEFVGKFSPDQTMDFYRRTQIINNYYGNDSPFLKYALSNKLYYAAALGLPILVCEGTYMYDISHKYSFGITLNENAPNAADDFYARYMQMSRETLVSGGKAFLDEVSEDNCQFIQGLATFMNRGTQWSKK